MPFAITVAPLTSGQMALPVVATAPIDEPEPALVGVDAPTPEDESAADCDEDGPVAIDAPFASDALEEPTVPATATPPKRRAPAAHTETTADHHSRVAGRARFHPRRKRSISPAMVHLLIMCPPRA